MTQSFQSSLRGLSQHASVLVALASLPCAIAQDTSSQAASGASEHGPLLLESYVVSATRSAQDPQAVPSSVSLVPVQELQAAQISDLKTALAQLPGVTVVNLGAVGGQSSVFLRGASSHQTLFVVDGIRMNDRSSQYQNFLGGAGLAGLDRLEVLRGPQGTLYGSSAMGGVIVLDTAHGCGKAQGVLGLEAGSFGTLNAGAAVKGGTQNLGYSVSLSHDHTENDRPGNTYNQWGYSTRIEGTPVEHLLVGGTFRGQDGVYDEPGSKASAFSSTGRVTTHNHLGTAYAAYRSGEYSSRLTLGLHRRQYLFVSGGYPSRSTSERGVADWQNNWKPVKGLELVGGASHERSTQESGSASSKDRLSAVYLSSLYQPLDSLALTAGFRHDQFRSFGGATTWRTGLSKAFKSSGTVLRATYGTGFVAPSSDDRYGVPSWGMLPSPDLKAEKSRGWDLGIEQSLLSGALVLGSSYFSTDYRDLIEWNTINWTTFEGQMVNRARASTKGLECLASVHSGSLHFKTSYTYLEAMNDANHSRLVRRPRHVGDAELRYEMSKVWTLGTGLHLVSDRVDAGKRQEDYTTLRLFTSYRFTNGLEAKFRVENALDEQYSEVVGYPALPAAVYGGLAYRF